MIFAISCWDKVTGNGINPENPESWLKSHSPVLYNFLKDQQPDSLIIGISAQGLDYEGIDDDAVITNKTKSGERAFVEIGDEIKYDLSLPLYMLINE